MDDMIDLQEKIKHMNTQLIIVSGNNEAEKIRVKRSDWSGLSHTLNLCGRNDPKVDSGKLNIFSPYPTIS